MSQTVDTIGAEKSIDVFKDGKSFIRLVDWCGDELAIVNAARVSFHNESEYEIETEEIWFDSKSEPEEIEVSKRLSKSDSGLINFLLRNKHGSPFEQGFMAQFHIRLPIFVMREWVRHRVGFSVNEESGRYVQLRPDFYYPLFLRKQVGKPGSYRFEPITHRAVVDWFEKLLVEESESAYSNYEQAIEHGIAKEQARIFLPLNLYTEIRWTCNARSLMNFLSLRNSDQAMYEIREYAKVLEKIFSQYMPTVAKSFIDNDRVAP